MMKKLYGRYRRRIIPLAALAAALLALALFWSELTAWFSGEPVGDSRSEGVTAGAGPFEVEAALAPDPPRQEDNTALLTVMDADGEPVEDAEVALTYFMPAMGSMPEMRGAADVEEEGDGQYEAEFDLPMGGGWTLIAEVRKGEQRGEARFGMTVGSEGLTVQQGGGGGEPAAAHAHGSAHGEEQRGPEVPTLDEQELPPAVLAQLQTAFVAYEEVRDRLAADRMEGVEAHANALAATLREAAAGVEGNVETCLQAAADAAAALGEEGDLETARTLFGDVSKLLIALGAMDPRLAEGWFVFECPMAQGYAKWIQRSSQLENPYMGTEMLTCGSPSDWEAESAAVHQAEAGAGGEVAHYTCSMHPSVKQEQPGTCPICAMDLTPVTRAEVETGTILIDEDRRRRIGVKTATVEREPVTVPIRAVGQVVYDESRLHDVSLRMTGWVERLHVDETGQKVERGQTLFTLYSPELYAAQLEYLAATRGPATRAGSESLRSTMAMLRRTGRQRLELLGMTKGQIDRLTRRGQAWEHVPFASPVDGYVIEKNVVEGAHLEAGAQVYRLADLDQVWVEAQVYESDLPHVRAGQEVEVTLPHVPGETYEGVIDYVHPVLDPATRTAKVRVVLDNPELELRPEMYANVVLEAERGEQLVVPEEAIVYTGPRRLVFVDLGGGRLRPQEVELGARTGDEYEVLDGLEAGDVVVTSGNFLIASESRLKSATDLWSGEEGPEEGDEAK